MWSKFVDQMSDKILEWDEKLQTSKKKKIIIFRKCIVSIQQVLLHKGVSKVIQVYKEVFP